MLSIELLTVALILHLLHLLLIRHIVPVIVAYLLRPLLLKRPHIDHSGAHASIILIFIFALILGTPLLVVAIVIELLLATRQFTFAILGILVTRPLDLEGSAIIELWRNPMQLLVSKPMLLRWLGLNLLVLQWLLAVITLTVLRIPLTTIIEGIAISIALMSIMIVDILWFIWLWLILLFTLIRTKVDIIIVIVKSLTILLTVVDVVWIVAIIVHWHLIRKLFLLISHISVVLREVLHWWLVPVVWALEDFVVVALVERVADLWVPRHLLRLVLLLAGKFVDVLFELEVRSWIELATLEYMGWVILADHVEGLFKVMQDYFTRLFKACHLHLHYVSDALFIVLDIFDALVVLDHSRDT